MSFGSVAPQILELRGVKNRLFPIQHTSLIQQLVATAQPVICIAYVMCLAVPSFNSKQECSVLNVTSSSVFLSWPEVTGATNYTYNYGFGDVGFNRTTELTSVRVSDLTPATTYWFHVTVHGQSGTGNTIACSGATGNEIISPTFRNGVRTHIMFYHLCEAGASYIQQLLKQFGFIQKTIGYAIFL